MWDAWASGDRKRAVEAVPAEVTRELIIRGSMDDIRAGVQRYLAAGIDTAFLQFSSSETTTERKREVILAATRALAPNVSERSP